MVEPGPQWVGELVRLDPAEVLVESGARELEALCRQSLPNAAVRTVALGDGDAVLSDLLSAEQASELSEQEPAARAASLVLSYAKAHQAASQVHQATLYTAGDRLVLEKLCCTAARSTWKTCGHPMRLVVFRPSWPPVSRITSRAIVHSS